MADELDPYYYARDHEQGPGAWCVRGPRGFHMAPPGLTKGEAYIIGKILSGKHKEASEMLATEILCREIAGMPV